jgi:hypothetical protein
MKKHKIRSMNGSDSLYLFQGPSTLLSKPPDKILAEILADLPMVT